jgi:hypothetical protein
MFSRIDCFDGRGEVAHWKEFLTSFMTAKQIQDHVAGTYRNLRIGLAMMGFAFPLILGFVGYYWHGVPWQESMSAYYFAEAGDQGAVPALLKHMNIGPVNNVLFVTQQFDPRTPMRSWFVGLLFVLGALMIVYKGFTHKEDVLLNLAGVSALGVALFPTGCENCPAITLHGVSAGLAFVFLALVAIVGAKQTLRRDLGPVKTRRYQQIYVFTAVSMVVFPLVAWVITQLLGASNHFVFVAEGLGLWSFAAYWLFKSRELDETRADKRAMESQLETSSEPVARRLPVRVDALVPAPNG